MTFSYKYQKTGKQEIFRTQHDIVTVSNSNPCHDRHKVARYFVHRCDYEISILHNMCL